LVFLNERGDFVAEYAAEPHGVSRVRPAAEQSLAHRDFGYPAELCNYLRKDPFDFIKQFVDLVGKEPRHRDDGRGSCRSAGRRQKTRIMRQQFDVRVD
jgi:hypothetical protein